MKRIYLIIFTIVVLLVSLVTIFYLFALLQNVYQNENEHWQDKNSITVNCIMVTGKDTQRLSYAQLAIQNFLDQDYPNKQLVIINHHVQRVVISNIRNVKEYQVNKHEIGTLGDLRNLALGLIPNDQYWTTWDDDDWRCPTYLSYLTSYVDIAKPKVIAFTHRYEYNINNGAIWKGTHPKGFVHFIAPRIPHVRYSSKDTMEDINILNDYKALNVHIKLLDNDPGIYIRLVHTSNTSLYVKMNKDYLIKQSVNGYYEQDVSSREAEYVKTAMHQYDQI